MFDSIRVVLRFERSVAVFFCFGHTLGPLVGCDLRRRRDEAQCGREGREMRDESVDEGEVFRRCRGMGGGDDVRRL